MYSDKDFKRCVEIKASKRPYRTNFRIDFARLIHSPSFRRLQGKTQLFPSHENDFFRNRLTHSLEVAQVAKSIAIKLNYQKDFRKYKLDTDLIEFSALAHDLGHPPFGHQGEEALDKKMLKYGGFEGNAQTLRLLARIEKKIFIESYPRIFDNQGKDLRVGLNLTARSLASILKYDNIIPATLAGREKYRKQFKKKHHEPIKGYYESEKDVVNFIKSNVCGSINYKKFKSIECRIMDISDDISYSTYDLEDTIKSGFVNVSDIIFPQKSILTSIASSLSTSFKRKVTNDNVKDALFSIFKEFVNIPLIDLPILKEIDLFNDYLMWHTETNVDRMRNLANDSFSRSIFTSKLITNFIDGVEYRFNKKNPVLSDVYLNEETRFKVEVLKKFNYEVNILSPRLKIVAYRGKEIIDKIFDVLTNDELNGFQLLPMDYQSLYVNAFSISQKRRIVCDFIAGMTDRYCIEFYGRLTSESPETIFKPI